MDEVPFHFPSRRLFEVGWEALSELELLALLLTPGVPEETALEEAGRILKMLGSFDRLLEGGKGLLLRAGLGQERARALLAAVHLSRRIHAVSLHPGQAFHSSREIYGYFRPLVKGMKKECFWSLLLDGKNRVLQLLRISEGSLTSSLVHPREVFRPAIAEAAAGVLLVHNHPSGDPSPSREDLHITGRLVETGKIVGIRVLDHVIIGAREYFSFVDQGLF